MNILIIDDNQQITLLLSKILANKGHVIHTSNHLDEGLEKITKENFDLLIIDAPLPKYEQLSVVSKLEKLGILQSHKVILFSGLNIANTTILELKSRGLYSFLKKPLEVEQLIQEISSVPSIQNVEITEKRATEEKTKKKLEDLRTSLSSLKLKLSPT